MAATTAQPWRTIAFDHVALAVPGSWPVYNLAADPARCPRLDVHAVYLGTPGLDPSCPAGELTGKTGSVQVMPVSTTSPDLRAATRPAVIGAAAIRTNPDSTVTHTIIDIVPAAGTEVSLSYGSDLATIRAIQATIRITGRPARVENRPNAVAPAAITRARPQGLYQGPGFDTCAAPSAAAMSRWLKSPYRATGIYIGGVNRGCAQANLSASWIAAIQRQGWHYFPFYVGLQASCVEGFGDAPIIASHAAAEGRAAANDAAQQAENLGIPPGTPLIYDMEAYAGCGSQVVTFLSAWDAQVHADRYVAGVYESFSNISDLIDAASHITEPDVIHYADWDSRATTTSSYMPSAMWTSHQRLHQYRGGHNESWGGATMNVDDDQLDVNLGGLPIPPGPTPGPGPMPGPGPTPPLGGGGPPNSPPYPFPFPSVFRIAVGVNTDGRAEWFATGASGRLEHGYQDAARASGWSAARDVGGSPDDLASNPAVTAEQDGSLTAFAVDRTGAVVDAWQQHGRPNGWAWGGPVGTGTPGAVTGDPSAVLGPAGAVSVFVADANGTVQVTSQRTAGDSAHWTPWTAIGGSCASPPVAVAGSAVAVYCITKQGTAALTTTASGSWQPWRRVGRLAGLSGIPAVLAGGDGRVQVFADTADGAIDTATRTSPAGSWQTSALPAAPAKVQGAPAAIAWPGGGAAVFSPLATGRVGFAVQQPAGSGGWSGWSSLAGSVVGVPAAWLDATGRPEAAVLDGKFEIALASYAPAGWSGWKELGSGF